MDLTRRSPMFTSSSFTSSYTTSTTSLLILLLCFSVQLTAARNFVHSRDEIKLTAHVTIAQTNCAKNETPIFVHTAAVTEGKYFDRRMTIRKTWAREAKEANLKVIFVIGIPPNATTQAEIKREAATYGDLLHAYLLRVDDDVIVNVPRLSAAIAEGKFRPGLTGQVEVTEAHREPAHKWYMPPRYYHADSYTFIKGFGYLLSTDRLPKLLASMGRYRGFVLDIDDVYVTGVLADYAKIDRHHDVGFRHYCGGDVCVLESSLVIYGCAFSAEAEAMYEEWKREAASKDCGNEVDGGSVAETETTSPNNNSTEMNSANVSSSTSSSNHSYSKLARPSSLSLNRSDENNSSSTAASVEKPISFFSTTTTTAKTPEEMDNRQFSQLLAAGFAAADGNSQTSSGTGSGTAPVISVNKWNKNCDGRNYRHVSAEMVTTNQLVINQTNCAKNETPIFVHTAAVTSGKYFDRRMTIRKTWGKEAKEAGMKAIRAEAKQYGDMLQFNFIEDYYNLTLKAVAELKWAWRHCANSTRYLMKVDDDVLVNVPLLKNWVTEGAFLRASREG
ncbi:hypothetical protein TYRP_012926 [Tyrophagus putrescentiae]|nr:hypothetical protein TYRP_012926 [Tyrophagus putrescentiae]